MPLSPTDRDRRVGWGLGDALAGWVLSFVASTVFAVATVSVSGAPAESVGVLIAGQLGLWLALVAVPVIASRTKGAGSLRTDFGLDVAWRDLWGLPIGVACQVGLVAIIYVAVEAVFGDLDVEGPARELAGRASGPGYLVLAVLVAVVAPIVEELSYRGLMLRAAINRLGVRWGVIAVSLVFGISHFQLVQLPGLFAFGVVLAVLAVRTGRLGLPIAVHVAFNAVTLVVLGVGRV